MAENQYILFVSGGILQEADVIWPTPKAQMPTPKHKPEDITHRLSLFNANDPHITILRSFFYGDQLIYLFTLTDAVLEDQFVNTKKVCEIITMTFPGDHVWGQYEYQWSAIKLEYLAGILTPGSPMVEEIMAGAAGGSSLGQIGVMGDCAEELTN